MLRGYRHPVMMPFEVEVLLFTKVCVFHVEVSGKSASVCQVDLFFLSFGMEETEA